MTKKCLLFALLFLTHGACVRGAASQTLLNKLFNLQNNKSELEKALEGYFGMMSQQYDVTDEAAKKKLKTQVLDKYFENLRSEYHKVYAKHFDDKDLTEIIKFYESPAGQKMLAAQQQISSELNQAFMQLPKMTQEIAAELKPKNKARSKAIVHFDEFAKSKKEKSKEKKVDAVGAYKKMIQNDCLTVVKFYADWCPHCKAYAPTFEKIAEERKEITLNGKKCPATFIAVDVDQFPEVAKECGVSPIPTTIIYKKGKQVESIPGAQSKEALGKKITESCK